MKNAKKELTMVKADFKFPDGTTADFEGSPEEVFSLVERFQKQSLFKKKIRTKTSSKKGPLQRIRELIKDDFFCERKTINDVQRKLEEKGHIYKNNQLSSSLKRLAESQELRRVKEDNTWNYVNQ